MARCASRSWTALKKCAILSTQRLPVAVTWSLSLNQPETDTFPLSAGVSRPYLPPAPNKATETVVFLRGKMFAPGFSSDQQWQQQQEAAAGSSSRQAAGKPQASRRQAAGKQQGASSRQEASSKQQASSRQAASRQAGTQASRQAAATKQQQPSSSNQAAATSVWPLEQKPNFFQAHGPKAMRSFNH